jgi:bacterioferritin-associated ferredoxin
VYVCLCHGFTDTQVKRAVAEGRRSVSDIYAALGGKPRCGRCVGEVRAIVACAPPGGTADTGTNVPAALRAPQTE